MWLVAAITAGGVVAPLLLVFGLVRTDAAAASLLLNLEAVLTALIAWVAFRENVDRRVFLGLMAIVAGGLRIIVSPPRARSRFSFCGRKKNGTPKSRIPSPISDSWGLKRIEPYTMYAHHRQKINGVIG